MSGAVSSCGALMARRLVRAGVVTYVFSALTLVANLVSGIVSARALGPDGRGVAVALTTLSQLAGFIFAAGAAQSLSYFIARKPEDGPQLLTTWILMLLPLAALAIGISELLLPRSSGPTTVRRSRSAAGSSSPPCWSWAWS